MWLWVRNVDSSPLAEECEAYLSGRYADAVAGAGSHVPAWAWLNLLAHGSARDLQQLTCSPTAPLWEQARAYLASELLSAAQAGASLAVLQDTVLQPLEAEAISREAQGWPVSPAETVATMRAAIKRYRSQNRTAC